jgi:hypothetical protein
METLRWLKHNWNVEGFVFHYSTPAEIFTILAVGFVLIVIVIVGCYFLARNGS